MPYTEQASALLKAMGNERRLLVLCHLVDGEKSVGELERLVDLSQSALSQHLARLRRDNLVETRRDAQNIYYSVSAHAVTVILDALGGLYGTTGVNGTQPKAATNGRTHPTEDAAKVG